MSKITGVGSVSGHARRTHEGGHRPDLSGLAHAQEPTTGMDGNDPGVIGGALPVLSVGS